MNNPNVNINVGGANSITPCTYRTVVLKQNVVNNRNLLTQSQISTTNTKYVIQWDFILENNIVIPAGCLIEFDGGSIANENNNDFKLINNANSAVVLIYYQPITQVLRNVAVEGLFYYRSGAGVTQEQFNSLAQVARTGDYNDLENKPEIPIVPTKLSAFENDENYQKITSAGELPTDDVIAGQTMFDTAIGKPVWYNGTKWVENDGATAGVKRKGTTSDRPNGSDIYVGFKYYDTDIDKLIIVKQVQEDIETHELTVTWVDTLGNSADKNYPTMDDVNAKLDATLAAETYQPKGEYLVASDISGKMDKVADAVAGHIAVFAEGGGLQDLDYVPSVNVESEPSI